MYTANGSGSGVWKKPDSTNLQGLAGDGGVSGKVMESDGSNGFRLVNQHIYGTMAITNNTNAFNLTAAADATLNTNSDYVLFSGTGAPWASENLSGITFTLDRLVVPVAGLYRVDLWGNITQFPSNTAKIGVKYRINGVSYSIRKVMDKSNSSGDAGNVNAFGFINLSANDYIQLVMASTQTGGLIYSDVNTTLSLVKAT